MSTPSGAESKITTDRTLQTECRLTTFSTFAQAPRARRQHIAAYSGDRNPEFKCASHRYKWG